MLKGFALIIRFKILVCVDLKLLHFALFCCRLATPHVPNKENNIHNAVARVEH